MPKNKDILHKTLQQEKKGRIAGAILRAALDGLSLRQAITRVAPDTADKDAWDEMHSVAHMWAARVDFPDIPDTANILSSGFASLLGLDPKPFLRRSEEFLDQMQSRPDLKHPDPWRCSPEDRALLGLPPREWES